MTTLTPQRAVSTPTTKSFWQRHGSDIPRLLVGAMSLLGGVLLWEMYARSVDNPLFTPTVSSVWSALTDLLGDGEFWSAYATTLKPFLVGWAAAMVVGLTIGLAVGWNRSLRAVLAPHLSFFNALPVSTLVPVVVIAFGIDLVASATVVFLFAVIDVILTAASGVRYVDRDLIEMGRSFGLNRRKQFRRIVLPGSAPGIAAAVRVGTSRAIVGMVVMELLLVSVGVGKLISRFRDRFDAPSLYAMVVTLAVFALLVNSLMRTLERRAQPWRTDES